MAASRAPGRRRRLSEPARGAVRARRRGRGGATHRWWLGLALPTGLVSGCQLISGVAQLTVDAREQGETCHLTWQCLSGQCVDGVCCDGPCDGVCEGCAEPEQAGQCAPHGALVDPDGDCGGLGVCDGDGTCTSGEHLWSRQFGGSGRQGLADMAVDSSGNVVFVGPFDGDIAFDDEVLGGLGLWDAFVVQLGADGQVRWSKGFGDSDKDIAHSVAIDRDDSVLVAGTFGGVLDTGWGTLPTADGKAQYVAKFTAAGEARWVVSFGDTGTETADLVAQPPAVAVDPSGDVYVAGRSRARLLSEDPVFVEGSDDVFVAKLAGADGSELWRQSFDDGALGQRMDYPRVRIVIDSQGTVVVAGSFKSRLQVGSQLLASQGKEDIFVARLSAAGQVLGGSRYGDDEAQVVEALAAGDGGRVLLAGSFAGSLHRGMGVQTAASPRDVYLIELDGTGAPSLSRAFTGSTEQSATAVAVDSSGHVIVAGWFLGTGLDFGGGALNNFTNPGTYGAEDVFLAKFDGGGNLLLSKRYGQDGSQIVSAAATDAQKNVFVGGLFDGGVNFGGGLMTAVGSADLFVAKLGP